MISSTPIVLNKIFIMAMLIAILQFKAVVTTFINDLNGLTNIEKRITVERLNIRLKCASFLESFWELNIP